MADDNTLIIEGKEYAFDDFELGDLEWLEDFLGKPLTDLGNLNSVKAGIGLVYLVRRREDPAFTVDQARKVKASALFSGETAEPAAKKRPPSKPAAR